MRRFFVLTAWVVFAGLTAFPASAGIIYNNDFGGVLSGANFDVQSWNIFEGMFSVADSFSLTGPATIQDVDFGAWVNPGDGVAEVDWWFLANNNVDPFSGTVLASGIAAPPAQTFQFTNSMGYDVYTVSFSIPDLTLDAGTYWLELAAISNGNASVFWDQSDGPSQAYHNLAGQIPSESFMLLNSTVGSASTNVGSVPEPLPMVLLGAGLASLGLVRRRKR